MDDESRWLAFMLLAAATSLNNSIFTIETEDYEDEGFRRTTYYNGPEYELMRLREESIDTRLLVGEDTIASRNCTAGIWPEEPPRAPGRSGTHVSGRNTSRLPAYHRRSGQWK
jgi:hypothetical protein